MPIHLKPAPDDADQRVQEALRARLGGGNGLAGTLNLLQPLPVYRRLPAKSGLTPARLSAWYYPVLSASGAGFAVIANQPRAQDRTYLGLIVSDYPSQVMQALDAIEGATDFAGRDYELRLLEIQGYQFGAIWLHAGHRSRYVALPWKPDTKPFSPPGFAKHRAAAIKKFNGPGARAQPA
jgi:hypothetical protein